MQSGLKPCDENVTACYSITSCDVTFANMKDSLVQYQGAAAMRQGDHEHMHCLHHHSASQGQILKVECQTSEEIEGMSITNI